MRMSFRKRAGNIDLAVGLIRCRKGKKQGKEGIREVMCFQKGARNTLVTIKTKSARRVQYAGGSKKCKPGGDGEWVLIRSGKRESQTNE